jgi:Ser/Thr protein kinase RdoA (MazF antagonist)
MEPRIKHRFNERILAQAARRFGVEADRLAQLDGFESFIYQYERDGAGYILRIGHSQRRSIPLIRGEVAWINYLADGGAGVSRAVLSEQGNLVELIPDGEGDHFLGTAFERAPGGPPRGAVWGPAFYERYGAALGRIHALSRQYVAPPETWRPHWDEPLLLDIAANLPATESVVLERFDALVAELRALPRDPQSYGPIHFDPHGGNLYVDDDLNITFFDFDDCAYGHYIYDVSLTLFYAVMGADDEAAFTQSFMSHFWRGYRRENDLPACWLEKIPLFLKLREIDLYAIVHRSFDMNNLDDPWVMRFMNGRKERIEAGAPYLDFDFTSLAVALEDV